ncbi:MAG: phenylacetate--CoA ligase [Spirochaetales bacterium]|nr:phenylacetate--CoA ligase [Spirochaetales bacterium]
MYEQSLETIKRNELEQLQIEKLQSTLNRVYRNVSFYRKAFDDNGVSIDRIRSIADLQSLPFTTKTDLRQSYPYDMFAMPLRDIIRMHATSGTTGKAVVVGYTKNDIDHWGNCTARYLSAAGVTEHDVVQIAFQYSLFTGGFGFHLGAARIGASVIPASSTTSPEKQITIMKDFKTTVLVCSPSYAMHLLRAMKDMKIHPEELYLKTGVFGSEPWSEGLRRTLEEEFHIRAYDSYGLTEVMGPGIAGECPEQNGLHINEDHFIAEIIDPETCKPLGPGKEGELVLTTITKEGFPLIRYRTGDITSIIDEQCPCGRSLRRICRIGGRTDDLIFINEQKVFPSRIEEILAANEGLQPVFEIHLSRENNIDSMEIRVEINESIPFLDELKTLEKLKEKAEQAIFAALDLHARVTLVEPGSLKLNPGEKAARVFDGREK